MNRSDAWNAMKARIERGTNHTMAAEPPTRSAMSRLSTTGCVRHRCRPGAISTGPVVPVSGTLTHDLSEQAPRAEDQDHDQDREREDVLVLGAEGAAGEERHVRGRERLEEPEHEPPDHGAGN